MITDLIVSDDAGTEFDASEFVTRLSVSLTADSVSQLTIALSDPFLDMLNKNVWQIRRKITYLGTRYEVASIEVAQTSGREGLIVEARSEGCQQLKRDKGQASFGNISPTAFAKLKADEFGLDFFGEDLPAKNAIVRAQNDKVDESSWTVLRRLASEYEFLLFETDNTLFFASEAFLLGKFAVVGENTSSGSFLSTPIFWFGDIPADQVGFKALQCPSVRVSDDSASVATLSLQLERQDGRLLRPGMTINLNDIPQFNKAYIVTEVRWDEGETSSISVSGRTPEEVDDLYLGGATFGTRTIRRTI